MGIGGSSYNNGISFRSDSYEAWFTVSGDNNYEISTKKRNMPGKVIRLLRKIPLIKGIVSMFYGEKMIALIIIITVIADVLMLHGQGREELVNSFLLFVFIILFAFIIKKILLRANNTRKYHGAEHKTIYAYDHEIELTLENVRNCPRVAKRCGTNLVVIIILVYSLLNLFIEYQSTKLIISYVLAYEVFDLENSDRIPIVNILFKIGNLFQEHVVTSEPTDFQLAVSIETMGKLIELDTAQQVGSDIA